MSFEENKKRRERASGAALCKQRDMLCGMWYENLELCSDLCIPSAPLALQSRNLAGDLQRSLHSKRFAGTQNSHSHLPLPLAGTEIT